MNKFLLGIVNMIIVLSSLGYGAFYLSEMIQHNLGILFGYMMFLLPAFVLSGISFYYGVRFLKMTIA